jgi:hypothetical protein
MDAHLQPAHQAETVFEPDSRARVETEQVPGKIAEIALAQRPPEPVGDAEGALELRHPQGGREIHHHEVGLRAIEVPIRVVILGGRRGLRALRRCQTRCDDGEG